LRRHKPHLKIIVGGPGSWQIDKKELQDEWQIDSIVDGEGEDVAISIFEAALRGEPLPRRLEAHSPKLENVPRIHHRSTFGTVEITRGCGRGLPILIRHPAWRQKHFPGADSGQRASPGGGRC
jgi:radical SAM superfamily enzyme YgiQ (UPF0313 family)